MSSRKTLFTLPITTYEAAFLATIPLPPGPFPRSNSGSSGRKQRKGRRSRWHREEEEEEKKYSYTYSTQYYEQEQVTNGHYEVACRGLSEGEYLDMFRPPTPIVVEDDGTSKLFVPEVIVTAGDRKGSFDNMEFNMYYEIHPESIKINCKNLSVPNGLANPNHYSQISGEINSFYPCSRLAEQADVLEKWLDGFYSEKDQLVNSSCGKGGENTDSDLVNNHSSSSSDPQLSSADRNNVQNYYQNDSNSCELNEGGEQVNGAWVSNSKVKLGKFKFLRNEHCSELVATSNRSGASGELRTTKSAVSDDSDSGGWATVASSDTEEPQANEGGENEENREPREASNLSKSGKKRGKGANSGSKKNEPAGERRRSSRIRSMEEKREREKLKDTKDDGANNSTSETSSPAQASSTPPPISSLADSRDETTSGPSLDAKTNESDSRTSGEFAVPPTPWNGVNAKANQQYRENESSPTANGNVIGPVKVKSRWRRCSELEGVVRDCGNGLSNSKMYNSAPSSPTLLGNARMVSELLNLARTPPPPPAINLVGFFDPGEITEDWSEQEVTTSLTKNPLPLKLRPVPPVVVEHKPEIKGPLPPPPPPPKEKPPYLNYDEITENIHLSTRLRSKARKEVRRMVCYCTLTKEEIIRGYQGCGEDCLNRLLFLECGSRCPTGERCSNRKFQKKEYANIEPFKTDKKGYGLKCNEDLDAGEFVIEYVGEVLDQREFKKRVKEYAADKQRHHYFMALKADQIIDATQKGNFSRFINHSCDPNCETQKWTVSGELRIGFFTRKAIKAGEEITFDYQFQRYGKEAQRCYCEASNCRAWIGGDKQTPLKKDKEKDKEKDKKDKKRKTYEVRRREFGEDLQEEVEKFSQLKGLTNKHQTLALSRLMFRADDVESRTILLRCLQRTEETACLRLFMDYQGLPIIWSWMMETGNNENSIPFKVEVLKTLSKLPVTSRDIVMENKLMPAIQKWATQIMEIENARKQEKAEVKEEDIKMEIDNNKENGLCNNSENVLTKQICSDENRCKPVESCNIDVDDEISCQEPMDQSDNSKSPKTTDDKDVGDFKVCEIKDESSNSTADNVLTNGDIKMECELENSNSDLSSDLVNGPENNLGNSKSELDSESVEKIKITGDQVDESAETEKVQSKESESISIDGEKISSNNEPLSISESISAFKEVSEKMKLVVLESSVANLAASLLDSWGGLKQMYRIPKREQAQNRKDHEREADGDSDEEDDDDDDEEDDREHNDRDRHYRDRDRDDDDRHRRDRSKRDHREDRDNWIYSKKRRLNSRPKISKEERRQLFERKVQQEEQEALRWQQAEYYRQQQEAQMEAQAQMEMYYNAGYAGLPGQAIAYYDPNSGYAIPAIASSMTADPVVVAAAVVDTTPTATPDNMSGVPPITTIVPTVIPQVVPLDPTITSPIAGVPTVVPVPPPEAVVPTSVFESPATPGPVQAPVVYPIYSSATNPASTGFIANSSTAPFVTPQGQPIYYPPPQGVVVIPPDQSAWPHLIPAVETPPSAPPEPPKPVKLPPSWKTAKDDEGNTYYYHAVTRQTQWDPPTWEEEEAISEPTPVENHKSKKSSSESSGEYSRRIKESFRSKMSQFIVQYLNPYRKPDCKQGRIASTEEFKHLARKLTHFVMAKELKYCRNVEDLECNENVKHKAKDFVKKYMSKFGANYKKTASPKDEDEI